MKRLLTSALMCSILVASPYNASFAKEISSSAQIKKQSASDIFAEFKRNIFVRGMNVDLASSQLVEQFMANGLGIMDLQMYVAKNSSKKDYANFKKMLDLTLEDMDSMKDLGKEELSFILQSSLQKTSSTGSHFISCSAGLGVGIPLIAVGLIVGLSAMVNSTASKEVVTRDYINRRQELSDEYLNTAADLELEIATYEADIIYYEDEMDELQRRIDSGLYSTADIEEMNKLMRDYRFNITDSYALIEEVKVDQRYFDSKYTTDADLLDKDEINALSEVDSKHKKAGVQAITAGIIGGVGAIFTAIGSMDCN